MTERYSVDLSLAELEAAQEACCCYGVRPRAAQQRANERLIEAIKSARDGARKRRISVVVGGLK